MIFWLCFQLGLVIIIRNMKMNLMRDWNVLLLYELVLLTANELATS